MVSVSSTAAGMENRRRDDVHNMMAMMNRFLLSLFSLFRSWNVGVPGTWVQYYLGNCVVRFILRLDQSHNIITSVTGSNRVRMILPFKSLSIDCQPSVRQRQRSQNEDSPNYICDRFPMPLQCHKQQISEYSGHSISNPVLRIYVRYCKLL